MPTPTPTPAPDDIPDDAPSKTHPMLAMFVKTLILSSLMHVPRPRHMALAATLMKFQPKPENN